MRVVVKIPGHAYAELVAELERIPARERAERLRVLANIGLTFIRYSHESFTMPEPTMHPLAKIPAESNRFRKVRERLQSVL